MALKYCVLVCIYIIFQVEADNSRLTPGTSYCGIQNSDGFPHDPAITAISEYPWIARIGHRSTSGSTKYYIKGYYCLGSLVNERYVVTAGSCVFQNVEIEVDLGEYHIWNKTDCVTEMPKLEECSNPVEIYSVEKIIHHAEFDRSSKTHNIALLRLNKRIRYWYYKKPICLPYVGNPLSNVGNQVTIADWSYWDELETKRKLFAEIISEKDCVEVFSSMNGITINNDNFCTKAIDAGGKESCTVDLGAPVMVRHGMNWYLVGIATPDDSLSGCRTVYYEKHTKIENYVEWMKQNFEP